MHSNNQSIQEYWRNEQAKYWPVSPELMAQYRDGTHTKKDSYGLYWQNHEHQYHRDGDLPAIIGKDGTLEWWQNDLYHRYGDRPAFIGRDGSLEWFQNGQRHRFRGPAIIYPVGAPKWCWRGQYIPVNSQEEFVQYLTLHNLTEGETMKPKIITAREALAIYEAAKKEKNLNLWETHAPKLDRIIREQSKNGHTSVVLDLSTWQPMVGYIEALGYTVTWNFDSDHREIAGLTVDWSRS